MLLHTKGVEPQGSLGVAFATNDAESLVRERFFVSERQGASVGRDSRSNVSGVCWTRSTLDAAD